MHVVQTPARKRVTTMLRDLGARLASSHERARHPMNRDAAPLGMLDVERITRVAPPISTSLLRRLPEA